MTIDLDAIRARLAAAKMPPLQVNRCDHARGAINWQVQEADHDGEQHYAVLAQIVDLETRNAKAKATLLCHAPDDIAALLAEYEDWQTRAERAETAVAVRSDYFHLLEQRDALRARVAELEAELANERGEGEPPSEGWRYSHARDRWEHPRLRSTWRTGWTRCADGTDHVTWGWEIGFSDSVFAEGRELTARAAMKAADVKAKEEV